VNLNFNVRYEGRTAKLLGPDDVSAEDLFFVKFPEFR
jgi:hypothetical protein